MCGQPDHTHDIQSRYDHETGVLRFIQKCAKCVWSRVVHEQEYQPEPNLDGSVAHMDDPALRSHVEAGHGRVAVLRRNLDQAVRRAA